jgi:hypothetical protein
MEKEEKIGLMEHLIKDSMCKERNKEKETLHGLMEAHSLENS